MAASARIFGSTTTLFSRAADCAAEVLVSLKRLQDFLLLQEKDDKSLKAVGESQILTEYGIWMNNVTATWKKEAYPTLNNISINVQPGELLTVISPVGSGKTSFLLSILGEIPVTFGKVIVKGKIAYASQEAWVFNGSIRENILFGEEYEEEKYKKVLYITALEKDISLFPKGDLTVVGERGVIMSGGQKARINLARALYLDADIFLLDDPLSAVDVPVAKHIFEKCIMEYLNEKICILVTHQVQFLNSASKILVLNKHFFMSHHENIVVADEKSAIARYRAINRKVRNYNKNKRTPLVMAVLLQTVYIPYKVRDHFLSRQQWVMMASKNQRLAAAGAIAPQKEEEDSTCYYNLAEGPSSPLEPSDSSDESSSEEEDSTSFESSSEDDNSSFSQEEESPQKDRNGGLKTGISVYKEYLNAGSSFLFRILLLLMLLVAQSITNGSDYWLIKWLHNKRIYRENVNNVQNLTFKSTIFNNSEDQDLYYSEKYNVYVYFGLTCAIFFTMILSGLLLYNFFIAASLKLHKNMFHCIIRTPISFLDKNPVGKVLNRFSKDVNNVDDNLPNNAHQLLKTFFLFTGMCVLQAILCPYVFILTFIISILFYAMWTIHSRVLKSIKLIEGKSRSPVFSHLSVSLYGLTTIRAFNAENKFISTFNEYQDKHTATWIIYVLLNRCLAIYGNIVCYINLLITVIIFSISIHPDDAGSQIGLVMSYTMLFVFLFQTSIRFTSEVDFQMNSVKRILKYSKLKSEASYESSSDKQPPADWPQKGEIYFDNVSLQYSKDKNIVLKNLTFRIHSGEKIGIVGRTGAGKSSIIASLFRMTEPTGTITIDGIDTKDIGLRDLRSKISIIPQDPMLFTGALRKNIDPFNEYSDEILWKAIEEVQLKEVISTLPGGLDTHLSEGGRNFSVGERQLICLARTIVRKNKILVMDEATSNIDKKTDSCIQKIIREKFKSCTVLTIAHRLHTIIDSDRVLVLDKGKIQEFDMPYKLLKNVNGTFYNLVKNSGVTAMNELFKIAENKYYVQECTETTRL
ncbi:multidrug resistance-associated protein 4-like [Centruroides sculpturatus]|uniref:multidrug resistance-associated protein 4-like n=1 Tax=Centruroides sculpturatus TaxID=218467 RepID=UPI000C6EF4C9|nr:multidrug resistance-associated protein 4-like [Centruroides sculpturatus]